MAKPIIRITRPAFTLIELLVVITIIALLVGITLVATSKALRAGQITATKYLMQSISEGLEQFNSDFGYYPPLIKDDGQVIDPDRPLLEAQPDAQELFRTYRYFSVTTLPTYLVGVGRLEPSDASDSSLGVDRHDGHAGPGFRDPGPDRSWGGAVDRADQNPATTGRVYGPYVDAGDGDSMRALSYQDFASVNRDDNPRWVAIGSSENAFGSDDSIFIFQDAWGVPIRYYKPRWRRRDELTGALTLDFIPAELLIPDAVNGNFQPESDREILSAKYVLLSAGPNREFTGRIVDAGTTKDLSIEPVTDDTNTEIYKVAIDNSAAQRKGRDLIKGIEDNIRIIR